MNELPLQLALFTLTVEYVVSEDAVYAITWCDCWDGVRLFVSIQTII